MTVESRLGCPDPFGSDGMAAFDTVDHDILLQRLKVSFGFIDVALQWLQSYLVGRSQYVRLGDAKSTIIALMFGVPLGSVLGPILFIMYTADLISVIESMARHHTCMPTIRCWLGLLTCKTVSQITYTVLVETLNPAQSINQSIMAPVFLLHSTPSRRRFKAATHTSEIVGN